MRRIAMVIFLGAAAPAAAQEIGLPAGCTLKATILRPDCEMHQVLDCEGGGPVRVDVYKDGVFLGEQAYEALAMTRWRRGAMLQELEVTSGDFSTVPEIAEGEVVEVTADRSRRMLNSDGAPMIDRFEYRIEVDGPAVRTLPDGGNREVRRFREMATGDNGEASDVMVDYDPALELPIWIAGVVTGPDGSERDVSSGVAAVYVEGAPGFAASTAPEGAACIAD